MTRSTREWVGKTDDAMPPPSVRLRIFRDHGGKCHRSGRKIRAGEPWQLDHIRALCNGGENREKNLAPILADKHREKTADDVRERVKTDRMAMKALGIKQAKSRWPKRPFPKRRPVSGRVLGTRIAEGSDANGLNEKEKS